MFRSVQTLGRVAHTTSLLSRSLPALNAGECNLAFVVVEFIDLARSC